MNTDAIESMVRDVLSRMNSLQGDTSAPAAASGTTTQTAKVTDYPLASKHPEWLAASAICIISSDASSARLQK